ncbi:MAG: hypothetical protein HYV19_02675 [Gemmatimonadetes bacterium]|nr:hypothetical protein [Gemmatimonadota bacterium]
MGAVPVAQAQATRTPNPNAPRLVVGTLRSADKKLSVQASEELRSRLSGDIPMRALTVLSSADYKQVVEQSGYPYDEALSTGDLGSLAKLLRTDEYLEGTVEKTATGYSIAAKLVLTRDSDLSQPLPLAEGDKLSRAASVLSKSLQDARKQLEFEKKCNMLGRDSKPNEAIAAAHAGVAAYPQATLARLCELQVRVGFKQPVDSIIAVAQEIIKIDPKSKIALTNAAQAYKDKGDNDRYTEVLTQLLATDPTNTRLVEDVVNAFAASGKTELAKPIIAQAIRDNPGDTRLMRLGFLVYLAAKDIKAGTAIGEEMVKIDTALADTAYFTKMVAAYQSDSNPAKATEVAAQGVAKFPKNTFLVGMLGQMQLNAGQKERAIASFRQLLALDPKQPGVRTVIARAYNEMGHPDSALSVLREAKVNGEDGNVIAAFAMSIGKPFFDAGQRAATKSQQSKASEDYLAAISANQQALPYFYLADSVAAAPDVRSQAKFFVGVTTFQIAYAALSEAPRNKSCELARLSQENIAIANTALPAGGRFQPQVVASLMPALPQIMQFAELYVKGDAAKKQKGFCP